jgi:hypothetical protein
MRLLADGCWKSPKGVAIPIRFNGPKGEQIIAQGFRPGKPRQSGAPWRGDRMGHGLQDEIIQ